MKAQDRIQVNVADLQAEAREQIDETIQAFGARMTARLFGRKN
ncbi:MAG: hypothetical protein ACOYBK_05430 [Bilifractor sp.]|jgi:hypothetical protein